MKDFKGNKYQFAYGKYSREYTKWLESEIDSHMVFAFGDDQTNLQAVRLSDIARFDDEAQLLYLNDGRDMYYFTRYLNSRSLEECQELIKIIYQGCEIG